MGFTEIVILLFIFSFTAWFAENICLSVTARRFDFNSFLFGPFAPVGGAIYLFAALALRGVDGNPALYFLLAVLFIAAAKFAIYHVNTYLLDMPGRRDNIFYSAFYAVVSGLLLLVCNYFLFPLLSGILVKIPDRYESAISSLIVAAFILVGIFGLYIYTRFRFSLMQVNRISDTLAEKDTQWFDRKNLPASLVRYRKEYPADEQGAEEQLELAVGYWYAARNLLLRFPRLRYHVVSPISDFALERLTMVDLRADIRFFVNKLFYTDTEYVQTDESSFAKGLNIYKMIWIFFIASTLGYLVETAFCLIKLGYIESRQGMIYGPFSQIYGFGAILLTLLLYRLRNMRALWIFIGSALIGGFFEAGASLVQETLFGTVSWDYTAQSFSLMGGRTNLSYMFFWGILGILFIRHIYPAMSSFVERIPNRLGIAITWVIVVFFTINASISSAALIRQKARHDGKPAIHSVSIFLDKHYPDKRLYKVYPNMKRVQIIKK